MNTSSSGQQTLTPADVEAAAEAMFDLAFNLPWWRADDATAELFRGSAVRALGAALHWSAQSGGADIDLSGALASNELCVAADARGYAYARGDATDEQLAKADADFVTAVEHIVGTCGVVNA